MHADEFGKSWDRPSRMLRAQAFGIPWLFYLVTVMTMTTGTVIPYVDRRTNHRKRVGNGMSLIITIGIIASLPGTIGSVIKQLNLDSQEPGQLTFSSLLSSLLSLCW